jgi:hypothetical protein
MYLWFVDYFLTGINYSDFNFLLDSDCVLWNSILFTFRRHFIFHSGSVAYSRELPVVNHFSLKVEV